MSIDAHVCKTVIPKSLDDHRLTQWKYEQGKGPTGLHDTDNQPYERAPIGILDVNDGMTRHQAGLRLSGRPVLKGVDTRLPW